VDGSQIREIRVDGVEYLDDDAKRQFIDFALCHANSMKEYTSPENTEHFKAQNRLSDEEYDEFVERTRAFKAVGARQIMGPPWADGPYVEFYTDPPTRFDLTEAEYWQIVSTIHKLGWNTFDMS
jgi:hypothetical protein